MHCDTTSGTWAMYFDGSDVDLATDSGEDVDGVAVANRECLQKVEQTSGRKCTARQ